MIYVQLLYITTFWQFSLSYSHYYL